MAEATTKVCFKWRDFQENLVRSFKNLHKERSLTDVTLACNDETTIKAHKMVLSACSPYFKSLLDSNPSYQPIVILKDVPFHIMEAIIEYMYVGEVYVLEAELPTFLEVAERFKVKGLTQKSVNEAQQQQ